ncbi:MULTISPECIES: sensor histidine kinase [Robinsoniella]|uniref:sensor histidine kinase n=1 Tax=Robinsoniella TaxID=588605 RepID=UPI00126A27BE|nr:MULTISPECIES: sensor histidine kinase [Robinsoniella]
MYFRRMAGGAMFKNLRIYFERMNFDKKMKFFLSMAVVVSTMCILSISTISSVKSVREKTMALAMEQINTLAENYQSGLNNYKAIAWSIVMDKNVQAYLKYNNAAGKDTDKNSEQSSEEKAQSAITQVENTNKATNTLSNVKNLQSNLNFLGVVSNTGSYLYKGDNGLAVTGFEETYQKDYDSSSFAGYGEMRYTYNNAYFKGSRYTLNIYQPIYDTSYVGKKLGLLCMNINETTLIQIGSKANRKIDSITCLVGLEGNVVTSSEPDSVMDEVDYKNLLTGTEGNFKKSGKLYLYKRLGIWDFYMVMVIPEFELYRDSIMTMAMLSVVILFLVAIVLVQSSRIVHKAYQPLDKVISKMDSVSEGKFDTRIKEEKMGQDFQKLSHGFNEMMDRIVELMEQVKVEQHQMEQIRFNALQSQIQPHFLYNTLDCIHWQTLANGDLESSTMVKALASYYRICLSKGKDIIQLSQELEHIKSYLTIQNIRYDHIIQSEIDISEEYFNVKIPKMTLQPLIENSIYHGLKIKEGKKGKVTIRANQDGEDLIIIMADSGTGMTRDQIDEMNASISQYDETFGYGVRNVNKRIEILYGDGYGLRYSCNEQGGVTVRIRLPLEQEIQYKGVL